MTQGIIEYQNEKPKFGFIRDGVSGSYDIVWRMIDITRDSVLLDKGFEDFIKKTVAEHGFDSYSDTDSLFEFLYHFLKSNVDYLQDIYGNSESIKDARTTIQDGYGDCDDCAILTATTLAVLGYSPNFVIAKYPDENAFQHVYTSVYVGDKRYVFDLTIQDAKLNGEVSDMQKEEISVFDRRDETDGVQGVIRNIKYLVKDTQSNIKEAAPFLINFLPFGFLEKTVAHNLLGDAVTTQSFNSLGSEVLGNITDIIIKLQNGRLPQATAQKQAHDEYLRLFQISQSNIDDNAFSVIESKVLQKISYINNFVPYGVPNVTVTNTLTNTEKYILYGVAGLGAFYLLKNRFN